MNCSQCEAFNKEISIRSTDELTNVIRLVQVALRDRIMAEDPHRLPAYVKLNMLPFDQISTQPLFCDDYLHYEFRCRSCDQLFSLFVEIYHGRGGSWTPVSNTP